MRFIFKALFATTTVGSSYIFFDRYKLSHVVHSTEVKQYLPNIPIPTRQEQIDALKTKEFDIVVIGGGATGVGVALDSISRGLSTALVEKYDFSSGTSSRSTKLIHGGVRYLQKAILGFDKEQYHMVKEALEERGNLIKIAPHLARPLPIMLPVYKLWQVPYYYAGIKAYDLVAGSQLLKSSYYLSKSKALELFPMLKSNSLVGAIVYYDGQHDDARMCISIAMTAVRLGANLINHTEVVDVIKMDQGNNEPVASGILCKDRFTGEMYRVKGKCIVNATGPYTDTIRHLDNPNIKNICQPSSGIHITLPNYYSPSNMGLLDPSTSDGRVIFFLPWENSTIAGTTDHPCKVTDSPSPSEAEIQFILQEVKEYLSPDINVRRGDVLSAWSGIRPLVTDPNAKDTQSIARNHVIEVSPSKMITIAGGKWTTYRSMAEETVDKCIQVCDLKPIKPCQTKGLLLDGAHEWSPTFFIRLIQDFGLDSEVAKHLSETYGDRAMKVAKMAQFTGNRWPIVGRRLHHDYPYIEAEVLYAIREYACTAIDVIARRTRLAFLNNNAAVEALPTIIRIMSKELGWDKKREEEEYNMAHSFLCKEMGLMLKTKSENVPINFTSDEINTFANKFRKLDSDNKGYITINDLRRYFKKSGEQVTEEQLHEILMEVDTNKNAQVDLGEFLQLMSALKTGAVSASRFAKAAEVEDIIMGPPISRSGGGV